MLPIHGCKDLRAWSLTKLGVGALHSCLCSHNKHLDAYRKSIHSLSKTLFLIIRVMLPIMLPVTGGNGKIGSAHTLLASIGFRKSLKRLGNGDNGKEIRHPLTNYIIGLFITTCMRFKNTTKINSGKVLREKTFVDGSQTSKL